MSLTMHAATMLMALALLAADATGKWRASAPGHEGGTIDVEYNLRTDGETLTGSMTGPAGELPISKGSVKGDAVAFTVSSEEWGDILHNGTIAGDEMTLKVDMGSTRFDFTAYRVLP
jgi:hypothetical protein